MHTLRHLVCWFAMLAAAAALAHDATLHIQVDGDGPAIDPMMHGVFFEDINYAADGGIYAELIQNRSFEDRDALFAWSTVGSESAERVTLETQSPLNAANPHYVRLAASADAELGIANSGYGGVALKQGEPYLISLYARPATDASPRLAVQLVNPDGQELASCRFDKLATGWNKYSAKVVCRDSSTDARLVVTAAAAPVDLDFVSLFPENTWKQRRNGMRSDIVQVLADMKPAFVRFPGGCIVEGKTLSNAYRWKETIGDVAARKQNWNRWAEWNAPHYYQSYGLGFFEYFQLCEDIGAEPVPILNCGMACQFQSGELVPIDQLQPWIQDALDLVEFANGPAGSTWGSKRAEMGHPEPFNLKYLGVGNEQWGPDYFVRYELFYKALKKRYPDLHIITTSGPGVDDANWRFANEKFRSLPAEIVDEHYYRPPQWFLDNAARYDHYDRNGPQIFAGEFASHGPGRRNDLEGALVEAAFMTGLVRNADLVCMSSYAPLFAKVGSTQWAPDLIWFDNTRVYGSPSYYVQQLYSLHRGDRVLPTALEELDADGDVRQSQIGVGTWLTQAEFKDIRVQQDEKTVYESDFESGAHGWSLGRGDWEVVDGALRQTSRGTDVVAHLQRPLEGDFTLTLKARKLGGDEGFLISFKAPSDTGKCWWNIGGWGNREHALEGPGLPQNHVRGRIETNRWYDMRVEVEGDSLRCFLDGRKIFDVTRSTPQRLYAIASYDEGAQEAILKVVNVSPQPLAALVRLDGAKDIAESGTQIVLTSERLDDVNTLDNPQKVAPQTKKLDGAAAEFEHIFAARSFTVLRVKAN